jgi:magnesium transporter
LKEFHKKAIDDSGSPPGLLQYDDKVKEEDVTIRVFNYNDEEIIEEEFEEISEEIFEPKEGYKKWVDIDGVHNKELISKMGARFNLHPLVLEDIWNTRQRPKLEEQENALVIILNSIYLNDTEVKTGQISLIINDDIVVSLQEKGTEALNPIRERIRRMQGKIRGSGSDYLAYTLIDAVVDKYLAVLEDLGIMIEKLEDKLIEEPEQEDLEMIQEFKKEMIFLRKIVWPLIQIDNKLIRSRSDFIKESTEIYLKDVYDHLTQVIDEIEVLRDMLSSMLDIYMSSSSNKMNEVMQVLTIVATIFIPLTFIVGVYGMNFEYMPELEMRMGYPVVMIVMLVIAVVMLLYFKWKDWF